MNTAILYAYIWLGLSVALVIVGLVHEFRHFGLGARLIILGGFGMLSWSAYNLHPTLTLIKFGSDVPKLQSALAIRERRITDLDRLNNEAVADSNIERARTAEFKMLLELYKVHSARRYRIVLWILRRKDRVMTARNEAVRLLRTRLQANKLRIARANRAANREKLVRIATVASLQRSKRHANRVRWRLAETRLDKQSAPAISDGRFSTKSLLSPPKAFSGIHFRAELSSSVLIKDRPGAYYKLRLLDDTGAITPVFGLGKYELKMIARQQLSRALLEVSESTQRMAPLGKPTLLVKGLANAVPFRVPRSFVGSNCFGNRVTYLPGAETYQQTSATMLIPNTYQNEHLPNLRAAYVACVATAELGSSWQVSVLQGSISSESKASALATEFYLLFAGGSN